MERKEYVSLLDFNSEWWNSKINHEAITKMKFQLRGLLRQATQELEDIEVAFTILEGSLAGTEKGGRYTDSLIGYLTRFKSLDKEAAEELDKQLLNDSKKKHLYNAEQELEDIRSSRQEAFNQTIKFVEQLNQVGKITDENEVYRGAITQILITLTGGK